VGGDRWRRWGRDDDREEDTEISRQLASLRQIDEEIHASQSEVIEVCPAMHPDYVGNDGYTAVGDLLVRDNERACAVHVWVVCMTGRALLSVEGHHRALVAIGTPTAARIPYHIHIPAGTPWRAVTIEGRSLALVVSTQ